MQINISSRHGHLSETNQVKIREKVEKLTRFFDRISAITVVADLEHKESVRIDLQISAEHTHDFVSHDIAPELIQAVDGSIQKMEQQLRKFKEKQQEPRHKNNVKEAPLSPPTDDDE